jgi:hypothetical protein
MKSKLAKLLLIVVFQQASDFATIKPADRSEPIATFVLV